MLTLTLPTGERRVLLRGFWLTICALGWSPWLVLAWWWRSPATAAIAGGTAVAVAMVAVLHEPLAWRVYRAWNRRVVRPFCRVLGRLATKACFLVVTAAGVAARPDAFARNDRGGSAWHPRGALAPEAYGSLFAAGPEAGVSRRWVASYLRWAWHSGHAWAVTLLPFLVVLSALPQGSQSAPQEDIYTLF